MGRFTSVVSVTRQSPIRTWDVPLSSLGVFGDLSPCLQDFFFVRCHFSIFDALLFGCRKTIQAGQGVPHPFYILEL